MHERMIFKTVLSGSIKAKSNYIHVSLIVGAESEGASRHVTCLYLLWLGLGKDDDLRTYG